MSIPVILKILGLLDYDQIATMTQKMDPARRVIIDLTQAAGSSSTHIAMCINVAVTIGKPVTVRGCGPTFAVSLKQMRLCHLVQVEHAMSLSAGASGR